MDLCSARGQWKSGRVRLQAASRDWCRADRQYYAECVVLRGLQIDTFTKHCAVSFDFGVPNNSSTKTKPRPIEKICLTRRRIGLITYYRQGSNSIGPMYLMNRQPIVVGSAASAERDPAKRARLSQTQKSTHPADETGRQSIGSNGWSRLY